MTLHKVKLDKDICEQLITIAAHLDLTSNTSWVSKTKGGIKEAFTVQDMMLTNDHRESQILKNYEHHQESGYTNYSHPDIVSIVPDVIFDSFNLSRSDCKVDVKKFAPGKIHIPHKDYYINYKYNLVDQNGKMSFETKHDHDTSRPVIRLWITLTEPKFGHILIVEKQTYYWLPQGSIVTWLGDELHTAANLGYEDRFIMTITGQVKS